MPFDDRLKYIAIKTTFHIVKEIEEENLSACVWLNYGPNWQARQA
jgi:hypothetical protein